MDRIDFSDSDSAAAQHNIIGVSEKTSNDKRTTHPDAQWFSGAGLGLFVHWGISSVHGNTDISWGMMANTPWDSSRNGTNKITPNEYFALAGKFDPQNYDPEKWLSAAAKSGFKYAVLTTKHHDGYSLWPTRQSDFGTVKYLNGRDFVEPFVKACRKFGLKVGLYYSPPDWYINRNYMSFNFGSEESFGLESYPEYQKRKHFGIDHEEIVLPERSRDFYNKYLMNVRNQVEELLTEYGKIDLIWFDGGPDAISIERIRELQPGIVINPRMHGHGDFSTPECRFPAERPSGWWELCEQWNIGGWGYTEPVAYRSVDWMISTLVKTVAWGGNFLVNCAPGPDGDMPALYYERLSELYDWMQHSGKTVSDILPGPYPEKSSVPVTISKDKWYLHFLDRETDQAVLSDVGAPSGVFLIRTGEAAEYEYSGGNLRISLKNDQRTDLDDVVVIEWSKSAQ